jgi:putative Flp pilus-assembly TadE/G-like protein
MNHRKNERGQALVLSVVALTVLLGMAALVADVGAWFRTDRRLQATADAAALAGAQKLPQDASGAKSMALNYADQNGGSVLSADITVTSTFNPNDTIRVKAAKSEQGIFSKVLGIGSTDIESSAKARVDSPAQARYVAPMVVHCDHPLIKNCDGNGSPQFGPLTSMELDKMGAPGAFGMLNLAGGNGTVGSSELANWIRYGYDAFLDSNAWYRSDPGAKFEASDVQDALEERMTTGTPLLFPVFKVLKGTGQNAEYFIIGWIGFKITDFKIHGHTATLEGVFTEYIAQGILASSGSGIPPSFGVKSIQLIE